MGGAMMMLAPPFARNMSYVMNKGNPNVIPDAVQLIEMLHRGEITEELFTTYLNQSGLGYGNVERMQAIAMQLPGVLDVINLYRRDEIKKEVLYTRAWELRWDKTQVDELLKVSEVIPSAGDIIRYAVREIYSPEIAEAFGQYDELPEVLKEAKIDIAGAGMSETTFGKEWALMVALDIMPAWRDKLTAISYSPFTRVDVRRMHKLGVLNTEQMFTAYAEVGFSPHAEGHEHATITEAFLCKVCRHESKVGQMTNFTLVYNNDPEAAELTIADKDRQNERDLTKAEVLSGYKEGLLDEIEVTDALGEMGYSPDEIEYYLSKTDYDKDKAQSSSYMKYLHDAYVRGVISFEETTDKLGALNLPAKQVEYLFNIWDLDKTARANKPTKSELSSFLRAEIISESIFRTEMQGLGYPEKYIKWYLELIEHGRTKA